MKRYDKISQKVAREIMYKELSAYRRGTKKEKGVIISNLSSVLHRSRKSIIRSMHALDKQRDHIALLRAKYTIKIPDKPKETRGRHRKYSNETDQALLFIWETYNHPCAERLYPEISEAIRIFRRDREWKFSKVATTSLKEMSLGAMKQRLSTASHQKGLMRGFSTTRASELYARIPIFHGNWSKKPIGYGQIDTVVHSGSRLEGTMAYTVNYTEMQTYWISLRAQLGKDAKTTKDSIASIERNIPFALTGLHPDSGDEFINETVVAWIENKNKLRKTKIELTRSRPSKKNDNCVVEERNGEIVRRYIGYERYDCKEAVKAMNELYHYLELYINFFQPTFKLVKKYRLPSGNWHREYDEPRAPFRRVLEHPNIPNEIKVMLLNQYDNLNPKHLRDKIELLTNKLRKVQQEQGYHF